MKKIKTGKLTPEFLEKKIFPYTGPKRDEVILRPKIGEDSAVIDFNNDLAVFSVDPITGAIEDLGFLSVNVSINDVVTNGAEPLALMFSVLLPESITEREIENLMKQINEASMVLNVEVIGGHTEITPGIAQPIITTFAIGKVGKKGLLTSASAKPGDSIIITKGAGIEGTSILASTFSGELSDKFGIDFVKKAKEYIKKISVAKEAYFAKNLASSMHDATEGGIYGAIYELSYAANTGFIIYENEIPVSDFTKKICNYFNIIPYYLISSGTLVITTAYPEKLIRILHDNAIFAKVVGKVTKNDRIVMRNGSKCRFEFRERDELWKVLERR